MNETMGETLQGLNVVVVEDEYFLADDVSRALARGGARVLGPVATVERAREIIADRVDAAVLDVDLRGEVVFPIADLLVERGAAVVFLTGYEKHDIPDRFRDRPHLRKPARGDEVVNALATALQR